MSRSHTPKICVSRDRNRHTRVVGWVRPVERRNFCHEADVGNAADAAGNKSAEFEEFRLPSVLPESSSDGWLSIFQGLHEVPESPILPSRFYAHEVCFYFGQFV